MSVTSTSFFSKSFNFRFFSNGVKPKDVLIVGGGVSGLSAGVYSQKSGFQTKILEQNPNFGGACTSWHRNGYLFEGTMHWLSGSSPTHFNNRIWNETGALTDKSVFISADPFLSVQYKNQKASLFRNPQILKEHLLSISPADKKAILTLIKDIHLFNPFPSPFLDVSGVKMDNRTSAAKFYFQMLPKLPRLAYLSSISILDYAVRFRSRIIREMLLSVAEPKYSATSLFYSLGSFASGDGAYLQGGSLKLIEGMSNKFTSLGGVLQNNSKVDKVIVEDGVAKGVLVNGQRILADAVIVTRDTLDSIDSLFVDPISESWTKKLKKSTDPVQCCFIGLGIEADLSHLPGMIVFPLDRPIIVSSHQFPSIKIVNYAGHNGYSPVGCSSVTVLLHADFYDYWKRSKNEGTYEARKKEMSDQIIQQLSVLIPEIKDKVKVCDVATPITYERYMGTYRGSYMTYLKPGGTISAYPQKSESIQNLYFAGMRIRAPGGLPVALNSGRTAVQYLCKDFDQHFC